MLQFDWLLAFTPWWPASHLQPGSVTQSDMHKLTARKTSNFHENSGAFKNSTTYSLPSTQPFPFKALVEDFIVVTSSVNTSLQVAFTMTTNADGEKMFKDNW